MRKTMTLSIILAAALGCSALALAGPGGQDFGPGPGGFHGHGHHGGAGLLLKGVNLTDAQKASIKQIMQQSFTQLKPQFQAVRTQREAFEALSPSSSGYQAAAASLAQAEANLTSARIVARAAATAQIYTTVLTASQQSQVAANKAAMQARKAEWQQFKASHASSTPTTSGQ
ncbi:MAG TPA: Spy/CpxP family protein refolding chaperone [Dyella sp.]|uniref:Spy/CpxP family protein refolding chaperone n=1 Tax=Dyella sp. TaxID=1869338 RepID=UPI002C9AB830|nr:Spy/CpxP family protein refolding chaperone [Dyella sp.]HTV86437.1 Spy/CpxP family protein refolding chaperone [Dyella sp.]